LLPHLLSNFTKAIGLDIAVAFTMQSGVKLLQPYLFELLERGGKVRFLTGDYLGVTEPDALTLVLDLEGDITRRVFETGKSLSSFHPKTYIFHYKNDYGIAFVGSSNLSKTALRGGVEWDYRVVSSRDPSGFQDIAEAFSRLFIHPATQNLSYDWIETYRPRHRTLQSGDVRILEVPIEDPVIPITPHPIQKEALDALARTRLVGNSAGLVVLATGLGKTWLSAFDSQREEFRRVLFVAHREEILAQARETFRRIRPDARLGNFDGNNRDMGADVLFALIQTIGKRVHLERFIPKSFDYIVVDEFHHGTASSYTRLIDYFEPKFLLGLTATPERTDGGDLLSLCQENLVYRCDLSEGIRRSLLCPFHYFGVPDIVDYRNIPWRNNHFDDEELTTAVATQARAANALDQYKKRKGNRTLAFCVSQRHADFMADYFHNAGIKAVAVHSGESSAPRAASLEQLRDGLLDVIFSVDMFNEGIDIPSLDTVLMLRPTESKIIWLQQFGRGLRTSPGKSHLNVIDYIGNHRTFLLKPLTLLESLMPFKPTDRDIWNALQKIQTGAVGLPQGCEITYELESVDILRTLLKLTSRPEQAIQEYYRDFKERTGQRPTAVEAYHEGFSPRFVRKTNGSWLRFVESMDDLTPGQRTALNSCGEFLQTIETTQMTRSYKMLLLKALLKADRLPGQSTLSDLTQEFSKLAASSSRLRSDLSVSPENLSSVQVLLMKDPIAAWTGAKDKNGKPYFQFTEAVFRTTFSVSEAERESFRELARELVDWRLAEYLGPEENSEEAQPADVTPSNTGSTTLELWQPYQRNEIAPIFGWNFSTGNWNGGFVTKDKHIFLLVTLDKEAKTENFQYQDRFLSPDTFQWQSQNKTRQTDKNGNEIRNHASLGFTVHLFVRKASKTPNGTGAPFHYCGEVEFIDWENERPITVKWRLKNTLPERLQTAFRIQ